MIANLYTLLAASLAVAVITTILAPRSTASEEVRFRLRDGWRLHRQRCPFGNYCCGGTLRLSQVRRKGGSKILVEHVLALDVASGPYARFSGN